MKQVHPAQYRIVSDYFNIRQFTQKNSTIKFLDSSREVIEKAILNRKA
jgi:hypothetical protein